VDVIPVKREVRVNHRIRVPTVRLIDSEGRQLGIMDTKDALAKAEGEGLDLVEVSPDAKPPVCRVMDFGKYKYEQAKRDRKAKKRQHVVQLKEVKLRPKIEEHDYNFKMNNARKFLEQRNKVRFTVIFRGRELSHPELGMKLLHEMAERLDDIGQVEAPPRFEGRLIIMVVAPKTQKPPKSSKQPAAINDSEEGE
jgi:translation initiation factor IF-3